MNCVLHPATDWTGHEWHERLRLCAQTLFIHGYLSRADWRRIERKIGAHVTARRKQEGPR